MVVWWLPVAGTLGYLWSGVPCLRYLCRSGGQCSAGEPVQEAACAAVVPQGVCGFDAAVETASGPRGAYACGRASIGCWELSLQRLGDAVILTCVCVAGRDVRHRVKPLLADGYGAPTFVVHPQPKGIQALATLSQSALRTSATLRALGCPRSIHGAQGQLQKGAQGAVTKRGTRAATKGHKARRRAQRTSPQGQLQNGPTATDNTWLAYGTGRDPPQLITESGHAQSPTWASALPL